VVVQRSGLRGSARRRLVALALAAAAAFAAAFVVLPHDPRALADVASAPAPVLAAAALAAWIVLTPALVSGTLLCAATGMLLGAAAGMPVSLAGATIGSAVAFLLARRLGRGPVEALSGPRLTRLRERVERRPVLTVVVARATPGAPATLLNYAAGLTRIRLRHFVLGIVLGGGPRLLAYTALAGAAAERALLPALGAGALLTGLGVVGALVARRRRADAPAPAAC